MFYQLPTGRVIEITIEQWLDLSDEEIEYLVAYNYGEVIENPWHGSILTKHTRQEEDLEIPQDLMNTSELDKLLALDMDPEE